MPESPPTSSAEAADATPSITRSQKVLIWALWSVLGAVLVVVILSKFVVKPHGPMKVLFHTPGFVLIDQDGQSLSAADLRGKVYICDFFFASCPMVCPRMNHIMAGLQSQTPPAVQLVSFTVDAAHDTPAVLKAYAGAYGADPLRWHFLTGTVAQMTDTVRDMKLAFVAATDRDPITHSEKFLLVDGDGNVRGVYDSNDSQDLKSLVDDAAWLSKSPGGRGW